MLGVLNDAENEFSVEAIAFGTAASTVYGHCYLKTIYRKIQEHNFLRGASIAL